MNIRPLGHLTITDQALDGSNGLNRAAPNPSDPVSNTDIEVTRAFLNEHKATPTTARNYTKETERLLLWAINVKGKPMSSLASGDISEFLDFLIDPLPHEVWVSAKKLPRDSSGWRPFVMAKKTVKKGKKEIVVESAGLSVSSRLFAMAAIGSYFAWLVDHGYLIKNPMRQLKTKRKEIRNSEPKLKDEKVERYLDEDMWAAFLEAINEMPKKTDADMEKFERAVFLSALMFFLAPRVSELSAGRMGHFKLDGKQWWWKVIGKGRIAAEIPVPNDMIKALIRYRTFLGLSPLPISTDESPLLPSTRGKETLSIKPRQINNILTDLFEAAAKLIETKALALDQADVLRLAEFKHKAEQLRHASAHWGRHTSITFMIRSGVDKSLVMKNARHGDSRTTDRYIHEDNDRWYAEAQKLKK